VYILELGGPGQKYPLSFEWNQSQDEVYEIDRSH
jgi:hypothetical protein